MSDSNIKGPRSNVWAKNGGVYFGYQCAPPSDPDLPLDGDWSPKPEHNLYDGDRHLMTFGPNGSGKSRRLLVPNLCRLTDWSMLVVDPKGELAMMTAAHRREHGNHIITFDPFRVIEKQYPGLVEEKPYLRSAGFNPLAALDPEDEEFVDDAKAIGEALIKVENENDPHWARSAQALTAGLAMAIRIAWGKDATLADLRQLLGAPAEDLATIIRGTLLPAMPDHQSAVAAKLNRFANMTSDSRELMSILSNAQTHTDWLDSLQIRQDLRRPTDIDFSAMKRTPITVYLVLPPRYLETHATWLRLMITAVLTPLIRTTGGKVPVLLMLDEFAQLGRLEVIERNMALLRGYGVKLWSILQDLPQLQGSYTKRWESFVSNAGIKHLFAPQDLTTVKYFSELAGQRHYQQRTHSSSAGQTMGQHASLNAGRSENEQYIQGPVYWPQNLMQMGEGQAVLFSHRVKRGPPPRTWLPDPTDIGWTRDIIAKAEAAALRGERKAV
jgi:type IV secretion system protein VirD4